MTRSASATAVVELTPPGRAAVAVVSVAGPEAMRAVRNCFTPSNGRTMPEIPSGRIVLGRWGGADGEEVIACRQDDEQIEIHCHGGAAAVRAIIRALVKEGCQPITWQDWADRCSPNPIRNAALIALTNAATERTAALLVDQLNGALEKAIYATVTAISAGNWVGATKNINDLIDRRDLGLHLTVPWRVVVFGEPNVGKSSLINALAGYERAIVSPAPGTTRDVVTAWTAVDGWPVQLTDTAGFRTARDELESAGIELATTTLSQADLVIFIHDAVKLSDASGNDETNEAHLKLASPARTIHAINKTDLISAAKHPEVMLHLAESHANVCDPQFISALTGEGIAGLVSSIGRSLVPVALPAGSAVPFTKAQIARLSPALKAVERRDTLMATDLLQALLAEV